MYQARSGDDFKFLFVIGATNNGAPPDASYCQAVQDSYGLTMDVVYDPTGLMTAYGTNHQAVVSDPQGNIVWKQKYPSASTIFGEVDKQLP